MHRMSPELPEAFNLESIVYTLNTHVWGPNISPFRSTTSRFGDTTLPKLGKAPNDLKHLRRFDTLLKIFKKFLKLSFL